MDIKRDRVYINKTFKYLLPCLKDYGEDFLKKFSSIFKLAVGIDDNLLDNKLYNKHEKIFILINKKVNKKSYKMFMKYIIKKSYYITDYCYDDVLRGSKHMIILKIPEKYINTLHYFKKGEYSKMYDQKEIQDLFKLNKESEFYNIKKEAKSVLIKDHFARQNFIRILKKNFGDNIDIDENHLIEKELDLPINKKEEIFNYERDKTFKR